MSKYVIIVDAYSAGNLLAPEFRSRGFECIHVQSTPEIWKVLLPTFKPEDFKVQLAFKGDLNELVDQLKTYSAEAVLPGTETGVVLSDQLAARLSLPGNSLRKSRARRDKFEMIEAARAYGLNVVQQIQSSDAREILGWKHKHGLSKIVIKPLESAGTDNVAICNDDAQIREAVKRIVGTTNMLGIPNTRVLAQEFMGGTEYFINTVSCRGTPHFTEIWQYQKRSINGHDCVYDRNKLLPYDGIIQKQLRKYVIGVLAALEITQGPAHTEVMMTEKGPMLVECGARMDGLSVPSVNNACVGYGPLDLTVDSYVDREAFSKKASRPYPLLKHANTVYLTSYDEGVVEEIPGLSELEGLSSFFQMRMRVKPASPIKRTIDYFTAPGFLTLVSESAEKLEQDYTTIRELERSRLFKIKSGAAHV